MRTKLLFWRVIVLAVILGLAALAGWWLRRPQVIAFGGGNRIVLLGVDYGTNHVPPATRTPPRNLRSRPRPFETDAAALVVWVRQEQSVNVQYFLEDEAGSVCVEPSDEKHGEGAPDREGEMVGLQFDVFPRRAGTLILRVVDQDAADTAPKMLPQKLDIANPVRGPFANWQAAALPDTQEDGDLSVTLTKLTAGDAFSPTNSEDASEDSTTNNSAGVNSSQANAADANSAEDPPENGVTATFKVAFHDLPATNWEPVSVDITDATGNHVSGECISEWQDGENVMTAIDGLWPDVAPWKLRVEFSRQSGFDASELWPVRDIPLQPGREGDDLWNDDGLAHGTNAAFAEMDLNGYHVQIFPALRFTDLQPDGTAATSDDDSKALTVRVTPPLSKGMQLMVVKLTDDEGNDVEYREDEPEYRADGERAEYRADGMRETGNSGVYHWFLSPLDTVKHLNLTLALHLSHFVGFTVKPQKAAPEGS